MNAQYWVQMLRELPAVLFYVLGEARPGGKAGGNSQLHTVFEAKTFPMVQKSPYHRRPENGRIESRSRPRAGILFGSGKYAKGWSGWILSLSTNLSTIHGLLATARTLYESELTSKR